MPRQTLTDQEINDLYRKARRQNFWFENGRRGAGPWQWNGQTVPPWILDNPASFRSWLLNNGNVQVVTTTGEGGETAPGGGNAGGTTGTGAPPNEGVTTIDTGNEEIISGLPLFNQSLRNLLSNIFTSALGTAARDVSAGNEALGGATDIFGSFLPGFLEALGIPSGEPSAGGPGDVPRRGGGSTPNDETSAPTRPTDAGDSLILPIPDAGALGNPTPPSGGEAAIAPEPLSAVFRALMSNGQPAPVGASPSIGSAGAGAVGAAETGAAAAAAPFIGLQGLGQLSSIMSVLSSLFGGEEDQPRAATSSGSTFEPDFESPNSLASFLQLLQFFGPGSDSPLGGSPALGYRNRVGASPTQGLVLNDVVNFGEGYLPPLPLPSGRPSDGTPVPNEYTQPFLPQPPGDGTTGGGPANPDGNTRPSNPFADFDFQSLFNGQGNLADNPLTQIIQAFSLPSYQGPFGTPSTPLQQQATDYASEFLRDSPFADPNLGMDTLQELLTTGGRFDNTEQFSALENITNRRLQEGQAQINELYGDQGLRYGSDVARGQAGLASDLLAQEAYNRAQIASQSYENATNRRLQALGIAPQLANQNLNVANQAFQLGSAQQQSGDAAIQRQMAEFARTQGALFPLLLQFALAGTEGDTIVLE